MLDFIYVGGKRFKEGYRYYPRFIVTRSKDLMIRGGAFYAIWNEEKKLWETDPYEAIGILIKDVEAKYNEKVQGDDDPPPLIDIYEFDGPLIKKFVDYCKAMGDNYHDLDIKLCFANDPTDKEQYVTRRLPYALEQGDTSAYDELMSTLYAPEERNKIEWAIGSIVTGESVLIHKFLVLYGEAGTGKSTVLNIINKLFEGHVATFDAKSLGSSSNTFAASVFKDNPLVALQHDGDMSKIDDNTLFNSITSHESIMINEKYKSPYPMTINSFLFMGTNKPVRITDSRSGLIRRLIDVKPTGKKVPVSKYHRLMREIGFELGAIAFACKEVYLRDPHAYDDYKPIEMMVATDNIYDFMQDYYIELKDAEYVTGAYLWDIYKEYCDNSGSFRVRRQILWEEVKTYFDEFYPRKEIYEGGPYQRNVYRGFRTELFELKTTHKRVPEKPVDKFIFEEIPSAFDKMAKEYPAQLAKDDGLPRYKWDNVKTKLGELNTHELHYVKVPENHIVIDFDLQNENGEKDFALNLDEANKWPLTYAELSKSGQGIHLHYIYKGDPLKLANVISEHVEVKVFKGNSSLRRKLSKCNNSPINDISSGLPLKKEKGGNMLDETQIKNEEHLRNKIKQNLRKEIHPGTKPSVEFIHKILEDAYNKKDFKYDVTNLRNAVMAFAAGSTHHAEYCLGLVSKMHFQSEDLVESIDIQDNRPEVFWDIECYENLFLICWKFAGPDHKVVRMYNPTAEECRSFAKNKLIGFNCRRYDNHMLYARMQGFSNEECYKLSQKIINNERNALFGAAYNLSYTDIYDFASAGNKKSLKKLEIEMGIHHQEMSIPWDKPVPENMIVKVGDYCENDVLATEAAFNYLKSDWTARQILADIAEGSVNDTTNTLTTKLIFGNEKNPEGFCYRNLAEPVKELDPEVEKFLWEACPDMMKYWSTRESKLPYFPGYTFEAGKSLYKGVIVGEGGRVYAEPGMYRNVGLFDIASQHPHSGIAECVFGPKFTRRFRELVESRVAIKHEDWEELNVYLDGKLTKYIARIESGEITSKDLANALKTAINSVYGLTAAKFKNAFRDPRNVDNIVAKRGALFMVDLAEAVQAKGYTVVHIKTDSIKVADVTPEIAEFIMEFGRNYGYTFEHEATYDKICLVNDAVYIAKYQEPHKDKKTGKDIWWTATGKQFQVPYVFKKLFSGDEILFDDVCETFAVSKGHLYLDRDGERTFIGGVGQLTPVSKNGGTLYRVFEEKDYAAAGSKGFLWALSEDLRSTKDPWEYVDLSYHDKLVQEALDTINQFGDYKWLIEDIDDVPWYSNEELEEMKTTKEIEELIEGGIA